VADQENAPAVRDPIDQREDEIRLLRERQSGGTLRRRTAITGTVDRDGVEAERGAERQQRTGMRVRRMPVVRIIAAAMQRDDQAPRAALARTEAAQRLTADLACERRHAAPGTTTAQPLV